MTTPERLQRRRGATLLVSIAILTLLAVFAIAFVNLVSFERAASANYVDGVRARMIARAGIERAIAEMKEVAQARSYSDPTTDRWLYTYQTPANPGNRPTSLLTTTKPSLGYVPDTNLDMFGQDLVVSGVTGTGTYGPSSIDCYKLKILDTQSQININHPDPDAACRMLKHLLQRTSEIHGLWSAIGPGTARAYAEAVIDKRPTGGFGSVSEVWQILSVQTPRIPPEVWLNASPGSGTLVCPPLREMLTVQSYVDPSVIRPWRVTREYTLPSLGTTTGTGAIRDLALMGRAPINLNTAARPVLTALFAELRGKGMFGEYYIPYGTATTGAVGLAELIYNRTHDISQGTSVDNYPAAGAGNNAVPFKSWPEFEQWLDSPGTSWDPGPVGAAPGGTVNVNVSSFTNSSLVPGSTYSNFTTQNKQGARDLIKAMVNPNTMLNKFGMMANHGGSRRNGATTPGAPRVPVMRLIDKSDITHMTTEGCFDSCGVYDITSLGLVLVKNEREPTSPGLMVLAAQTMQTVVRIYDVLRLTTQTDFETNRALFTPGDFITAFDRDWIYDTLETGPANKWCPGVNKPAFGLGGSDGPFATACRCAASGTTTPRPPHQHGFEGWPGVTSFPAYSCERAPSGEGWIMGSEYSAASWDGHLELSNLQLQEVWPQDFVAGFARGSLKAFKCRVWWEPKDQMPTFSGTGAWNGNPKTSPDMSKRPTRGHDVPGNDGDADGVPYSDVIRLTSPSAASFPRTVSKGDTALGVLGAPNPLDAVPGKPVPGADPKADWFLEGSALTANGIMIDRRRIGTDNTTPGYFTFDGDNIDLFQGTSIRFWVMPTADRHTLDEVLFSWVGDQSGTNRRVGFVIKKTYYANTGALTIDLEAHVHDNSGSLAGTTPPVSRISIPVHPRGGVAPDPFNPEWTPGLWKWIVLNFGAFQDGANPLTYQATLQVDRQRATLDMNRRTIGGFGEIHGNRNGTWLAGENLLAATSGGGNVVAGTQQKQLGDWYHCDTSAFLNESEHQQRWYDVLSWSAGNGNGNGNNGNGNGNTGRYEKNGNWPSNPFPADAYDKRLTLEFRTRPVANPLPNPARTGSMTANGPNWDYAFQPLDLGPNKTAPDDDDYRIDLLAQWKTLSGGGARCSCCADSVGCGYHCQKSTKYWGAILYPPYCARAHKGQTVHGGLTNPGPSPPDPTPINGTCDGCNGCEACDIDAPMFFGGQPAEPPGGSNKGASTVALVDPNTMAHAVFDNIVIKNNKERRSDLNNQRPEDRFYQDTLVQATSGDTGAIYRRGLLEIAGVRCRLGTLTWTSYTTTPWGSPQRWMDFAADLYRLPGGAAGQPTFRFANNTMMTGATLLTQPVPEQQLMSGSTVVGYRFTNAQSAIDTTVDPSWNTPSNPANRPYPKDLLILQIALKDRLVGNAGAGSLAPTNRASKGIPTPILETPVLEDVTLTLIKETVQILRAEEGVEE
jgi:hypothetical protein